MDSKVLVSHVLDGQRDVSGLVAEVVAAAAVLVLLVLDVVTQQILVGILPLDGEIRLLLLVLKVVKTLQADSAAWRRDHPDGAAAWGRRDGTRSIPHKQQHQQQRQFHFDCLK